MKSGFTGLYRGHSVMLLRIFPYAAIQFMSYEEFKRLFCVHKIISDDDNFNRFLAGSLAGNLSTALKKNNYFRKFFCAFDVSF